MAEESKSWILTPRTLYELGIEAVVDNFHRVKECWTRLPDSVLFDVLSKLHAWREFKLLGNALSNFEMFSKLLKVSDQRVRLLVLFQTVLVDGMEINKELEVGYGSYCFMVEINPSIRDKVINLGLKLGKFLSDAGCYVESESVLLNCKDLCMAEAHTPQDWCRVLDCCHKLLHTQSAYCELDRAAETYKLALLMISRLTNEGYTDVNHAGLYTEFSVLFFIRSEFNEAYKWSVEAMKHLKPTLPANIIVDVFRQAGKACIVKREFQRAGLLIQQASYLARQVFGPHHLKYSDALVDYGFYLLNYDSFVDSVSVYEEALQIRRKIFGRLSLHIATVHEELAYALYVQDYVTGKFQEARLHAEIAIKIMEMLLPNNHFLLASAKRIKALILEEIALDTGATPMSGQNLLLEAESLHLSALKLTESVFGKENVLTAKHYGNLGRLYQSMQRYKQAEEMHLTAINIKEALLGPDDLEVGLSIGHLASLYTYHLDRHLCAEKLYFRSIEINIRLFGESYSGLEYDYQGLLRVYTVLHRTDKQMEYTEILNRWRRLRENRILLEDHELDLEKDPDPVDAVIQKFFNM
ncbi:amyloid protein-binding protein 2 [Orussus abietinus]|uniref:amyloid protein-binding protein 2 n=1 Tax=Orussus abietinus TaxID=222816 RepID=UPI0006257CBA|nr:amyloid protein-binding protein 2 [Orussus abietinus]